MSRKGIMLCTPFNEARVKSLLDKHGFLYAQPKLNGHRGLWTGYEFLSSEGNKYVAVPELVFELELRFSSRALDGELYIHGASRQEISSIVKRTKDLHPSHSAIEYHVFDIPLRVEQRKRFEALAGVDFMGLDHIKKVETLVIVSLKDYYEKLKHYIDLGYEGLVVRSPTNVYSVGFDDKAKRSSEVFKYKPFYRDTYRLVKLHEGSGKYAHTLGALTVEDDEGNEFDIGSFAIDDNERDRLWARRRGLERKRPLAQIRYMELSLDGKPPSATFELFVES